MKVERLISIILILLDQKRVSAQQLATSFEVSLRTIYRDIDTIDRAGVPIRATAGVGGGFEIMPQYKIDQQVFSTADLTTLLMALSSLSDMLGKEEVVNVLAKVKHLIPSTAAKEIGLKANQVQIDLNSWIGNKEIHKYLEIVKTALNERKLVSFEYLDRYGNQTNRTVEPYQLVFKSGHWYWQGYCLKRQAFRLFRLSRVIALEMEEQTFSPREYEEPTIEFRELLAKRQTTIKIRVHQSILSTLLDYCSYDSFVSDGAEHYIVAFPFIENDYYYNLLLSFGVKCECLEPLSIRTEMKRRVKAIAALYE